MAAQYFVECKHRSGPYFPECNTIDKDRATVVRDIANGQYDDILTITEVNVEAGTARDVTKDIACDIVVHLECEARYAFPALHRFLSETLHDPLPSLLEPRAA